jgi:poly(3-hydroxybutyrate) depolymerase
MARAPAFCCFAAALSCATSTAHETTPTPLAASSEAPPDPGPARAESAVRTVQAPAEGAAHATSGLATSDPPPAPKLAPLQGVAELAPLVVPDFRDAIVSVPLGATEGRPVVLALHGNYDRPEWQCGVWREVTKAYPFIVCPRGIPRRDAAPSENRFTYGKPADVRREIDAALAALQIRFGDYIAAGPIVYTGFSLGAILGVGIVADDADRFPRAVLVEGGQSNWSQARAKSYAAAGGKRVLFACGQRACRTDTKGPEKLLGRLGVETRSVYGGEVGHTYDGRVAEEIGRAWPWLVGDDPRWPSR